MNIQGTTAKNVVYECLIRVQIQHKRVRAILCHPYLCLSLICLEAVWIGEYILLGFYISQNFLHDLFIDACSCRTAPRQGCSVLQGSVLLPLMSTNTASASVLVTPTETSTEGTPRGITPYQTKTSNLQRDSFLKNICAVGLLFLFRYCTVDSEWAAFSSHYSVHKCRSQLAM